VQLLVANGPKILVPVALQTGLKEWNWKVAIFKVMWFKVCLPSE
jgi:hypothetical protein